MKQVHFIRFILYKISIKHCKNGSIVNFFTEKMVKITKKYRIIFKKTRGNTAKTSSDLESPLSNYPETTKNSLKAGGRTLTNEISNNFFSCFIKSCEQSTFYKKVHHGIFIYGICFRFWR